MSNASETEIVEIVEMSDEEPALERESDPPEDAAVVPAGPVRPENELPVTSVGVEDELPATSVEVEIMEADVANPVSPPTERVPKGPPKGRTAAELAKVVFYLFALTVGFFAVTSLVIVVLQVATQDNVDFEVLWREWREAAAFVGGMVSAPVGFVGGFYFRDLQDRRLLEQNAQRSDS